MAEISAAAVKSLRDKTGLPMMDCKKALQETGGDQAAAEDFLRKQGKKTEATRLGRETTAGRIAVFADTAAKAGAIIELKCESAPVANSPDFIQFANEIARQLATGPGAVSPDELLKQPSSSQPGKTLADVKDDMFNRIREVFNLTRIARIEGSCGGYAHHDGRAGALVRVEGGDNQSAKDVAMHIVAIRPAAVRKEDLDPAVVAKEREIQMEVARKEGKPENIIAKMVEGRLKNFYAAQVLEEQPFVKDESKSVGKMAQEKGMKVVKFIHLELAG